MSDFSTYKHGIKTITDQSLLTGEAAIVLDGDLRTIADLFDSSGISGFSGYSGYSGATGPQGTSGFSGYSGVAGSNGTSGFSGYSGFSGKSGFSGYSGTNGTNGTSGFSGYSGYSGTNGATGTSGFSGYSGKSGYSGYSGATGSTGGTGTSGFSGYSGISGFSGTAGAAGGSNTDVQYNSSGSFAGNANLTYDGTTLSGVNLSLTGNIQLATTKSLVDVASNPYLQFAQGSTGGSNINFIKFTNATTTNPPTIFGVGSDTNVNLNMTAKGTGVINITGSGGLNVSGGNLQVGGHKAIDTSGFFFYRNGNQLTDISNDLLYGGGGKLTDVSNNLYYGDGNVVAGGSGSLFFDNQNTFTDGSTFINNIGGDIITDGNSFFYSGGGCAVYDSGNIYEAGGNFVVSAGTIWYPDASASSLADDDGLHLKWFGGAFESLPSSPAAGTLGWDVDTGTADLYDGGAWSFVCTSKIRIEPHTSLTDASTVATDASNGSFFRVTLAGNRTLGNPTNAIDGQMFRWIIKQDGTGSRTLTLGTNFVTGPFTVTLSTAANAVDMLGAEYDSGAGKFRVVAFLAGYAA